MVISHSELTFKFKKLYCLSVERRTSDIFLTEGRFTHTACRASKGLECLSHLIYTVRPRLIHTCHAAPMPCSNHAVLLKVTAQHGRLSTAMLCCGLEKNGVVRAWHGLGIASVNQTRQHCINQMGKTHSKALAARHGRGTAWARHAMCESAFKGPSSLLGMS
jgi:hypothetical protein